jgi:hypothetical protein
MCKRVPDDVPIALELSSQHVEQYLSTRLSKAKVKKTKQDKYSKQQERFMADSFVRV